jgi:eight-cysteine-cluster-containing protein
MKRFLIIFIFLFLVGCVQENPDSIVIDDEDFCGWSQNGACSSDAGCITGGCSGQICGNPEINELATTCEWKECYDDTIYGLSCGCVQEQCQWF